ncbi:acyl-CoA thioesterase [Marinomonas algicola]|jgi:thioesterase III|uniref:acyl-CoA thioesterase n=1 Tax=Marinomonas algicola TaxID=2773454 RepID=UPI00174CA21C|nr:thioesterase family protein [Marinomonas algicola]
MIHSTLIKVRGFHIDVFQHVNNARYLEFLEEGRWAFFDDFDSNIDLIQQGIAWAVVNINIDFKSEASFGDVLEVRSQFSKLGKRSITMKQTIINSRTQDIVVEADVTYVCFSKELKAAIPLPEAYRLRIEKAIV